MLFEKGNRAVFEIITQIDYTILQFIHEYLRFEWLNGPFVFISHLGDHGLFWIVLCLLLLIPKRTRKMGICGLAALLIGALITNVSLKNIVARIRPYEQFPDIVLLLERQTDFSFPSGHSCSSFAAAAALYWSAGDEKLRRIGIASLVLASLIAWSRLYVGVHFPTDVAAGILIGLFCGWIVKVVCEKYRQRERYREKSGRDE